MAAERRTVGGCVVSSRPSTVTCTVSPALPYEMRNHDSSSASQQPVPAIIAQSACMPLE
jgi:hypothetical protein